MAENSLCGCSLRPYGLIFNVSFQQFNDILGLYAHVESLLFKTGIVDANELSFVVENRRTACTVFRHLS